jgi:two-component system sensor histidine kinase/response regulator
MVVGFILIILAIGASVTVTLLSAKAEADIHAESERIQQTMVTLVDVVSTMKDAETGNRGFVITQNPEFLAPYNLAMAEIDGKLAQLKNLLADQPDQLARFEKLKTAVEEKKTIVSHSIRLVTESGQAEAIAFVQTGQGKHAMDRIRALQKEMTDAEQTHLGKVRKKLDAGVQRTLFAYAGLVAVVALVLVVLFYVIRQDIRKRAEAEQAIRRLALIAENTVNGVVLTDPAGTVIWANASFINMMGIASDQIAGRPFEELINPSGTELSSAAMIRASILESHPWEGLLRIPREDRGDLWAQISLAPMADDAGQHLGLVAILTDISSRREMEVELERARDAALQSARMKSEFLANMSHEIRTPMNGIVGMSGLLLDTKLNAEQKEFASTVRNCADALLSIINDILDFSKIEAGKLRFDHSDFDLHQAIEETADLMAPRAAGKKIELGVLIENNVPRLVCGDAGRLRQVLLNLAGNAVKFTDQGGVLIRVHKESDEEKHVILRISVTDTGIGIPADQVSHLFQPFMQLDSSSTKKFGGTGLGLAISKQLVELMGGTISVNSEPGRGSIFSFTAQLEKQGHQPDLFRATRAFLHGTRILAVDDNPTNRTILQYQLGSWGFEGTLVNSAEEAITALSSQPFNHPFELVILDFHMPEVDGLQLAAQIRAVEGIKQPVLLMLTSLGQLLEPHITAELDIFRCLSKPIKASQLLDTILAGMARRDIKAQASGRGPAEEEPAATEEAGLLASPSSRHLRKTGSIHLPLRILLAEDNPVNQKVALHQLQKLGFRAEAVGNGLEAVSAMRGIPYDLILMDCQMPEMDGYTATRAIRSLPAPARDIVIVALTANALQGDREKCIEAGMDDYLSKPVNLAELRQVFDKWHPICMKRRQASGSSPINPDHASLFLDRAHLQSVLPAAPEAALQVLRAYVLQTSQQLSEMRDKVVNSDFVRAAQLAHQAMGNSLSLGAVAMETPLRQLETAAQAGQAEKLASLLEEVEKEFWHTRRYLELYESELTAAPGEPA